MRKLPVFRSVGEVLSGVTRHYFQLLFAAWPAILLLLVSVGLAGWIYYSSGYAAALLSLDEKLDAEKIEALQAQLYSGENGPILTVASIVSFFAAAVAAVRWHRFVLLGEGGSASSGKVHVLRVEDGAYVWAFIKIFLVVVAFMFSVWMAFALPLLFGSRSDFGGLTLVIVPIVLFGFFWAIGALLRLMLILPDAALGRGGRVADVFRASSGNAWRLFGFWVLLDIATLFVLAVIVAVFGAVVMQWERREFGMSPLIVAFAALAYVSVYLFYLMTQVTMLSVAYREIVGLPAEGLADAVGEAASA